MFNSTPPPPETFVNGIPSSSDGTIRDSGSSFLLLRSFDIKTTFVLSPVDSEVKFCFQAICFTYSTYSCQKRPR